MIARAPLAAVVAADGRTVGHVTATADGSPDPFLAAVMLSADARETAESARRDAIRSGAIPPDPPAGRWMISDRD
jgi:hypothetical protein